jgi:UDP-N-acetylglucosamine diphosphorylase/glucosamine-1-phosphate N-acetyltransferase
MNCAVVILAAGMGKRMLSPEIPKVLAKIDNKPLIYYVLKTAIALEPEKICVIVGHKKQLLVDYIQNDFLPDISSFPPRKVEFAEQKEQLGTGHAVMCSRNNISDSENVIIMAGDVPLLTFKTLRDFMELHSVNKNDISVLSATAPDPYGYGRIVRQDGRFTAIVEEKDAVIGIRQINEINSGVYFLSAKILFDALQHTKNDNNQHEYYLTDIVDYAVKNNYKVEAINIATFEEIQGINTQEQLKRVEQLLEKN